MNRTILAVGIATIAFATPITAASAANVPCEEMLKTLRSAEASATLTAEQKTKVGDLETKGIERCNAEDDKRADDFFAQAMAILGK